MNNRNKNHEDYPELFEKYSHDLKKLCNIKLDRHKGEIDDVMTEIKIDFAEFCKNGKPPDNPKAWLYSTANNIIKSKYSEINNTKKHYDYSTSDTILLLDLVFVY